MHILPTHPFGTAVEQVDVTFELLKSCECPESPEPNGDWRSGSLTKLDSSIQGAIDSFEFAL